MATIQDVAKRAGVSVSTVSYAVNGTRPISEETRQRIFAAMQELGYRPHALARGLASKRSRIIALLFPTPERGLGITELDGLSLQQRLAMKTLLLPGGLGSTHKVLIFGKGVGRPNLKGLSYKVRLT